MFVSDRIVFVELHKTGGTHIGQWLATLVGGQQVGKHNRVPRDLYSRFIIGSVRNPWDWYVSLWAYGCSNKGSVRRQTTRKIDLKYCYDELPHEMGKHWLNPIEWARQISADCQKPVALWRNSYRDPKDPAAFREWLHLLLDSRRRFDIGEGFGFSPVSQCFGLMTYRYLKLFTKLDNQLYRDTDLKSLEHIRNAWNSSRIVSYLIRNEHLEADLIDALNMAGCILSADQETALHAAKENKINASQRETSSYYYDRSSLELVQERERFIIENHGYCGPQPFKA